MKHIRNSAKAIIVQDERILLIKNEDQFGFYYLFPGGGQDFGEVLSKTVIRECLEEIGVEVTVGDLIHVREYIGKNHEFAVWDRDVHQIEYYFKCCLPDGEGTEFNGSNPDSNQVGVEWMEIENLNNIRLYPKLLGKLIQEKIKRPIYLGDVN